MQSIIGSNVANFTNFVHLANWAHLASLTLVSTLAYFANWTYLAYLDDTNYSDSEMFVGLEDDIIQAFDNSMQKIELLNDNFFAQINTDHFKMLAAFDAIQVGVVRLKTNMMSILGISVDYFDADGD